MYPVTNLGPEDKMYKIEKRNIMEDKFEELMQRLERMEISWKTEKALGTKNVEVGKQGSYKSICIFNVCARELR